MLNRQIQMSGFERSILLISELGGGGTVWSASHPLPLKTSSIEQEKLGIN